MSFCHDHVQVASLPASPRGANYTGYLQIESIPCDFDAGVVWATVVLFEILKHVEIVVCMPTVSHTFTPQDFVHQGQLQQNKSEQAMAAVVD
jgi:hypothetical protein